MPTKHVGTSSEAIFPRHDASTNRVKLSTGFCFDTRVFFSYKLVLFISMDYLYGYTDKGFDKQGNLRRFQMFTNNVEHSCLTTQRLSCGFNN